MAVNPSKITWTTKWIKLPKDTADGGYIDKANIEKAMEQFQEVVAALPARYQGIRLEAFQSMCDKLCLCSSDDGRPLGFAGFNIKPRTSEGETFTYVKLRKHSEPKDDSFAEVDDEQVDDLNKMPPAEKEHVKFAIQIMFGTLGGGVVNNKPFDFNERAWLETIIHEVAIHATEALEMIRLWRLGLPWPKANGGEFDHLLFRHRGTPMYIWMCNQLPHTDLPDMRMALDDWNRKEIGRYRDSDGWGAIKRLREALQKPEKFRPSLWFDEVWMMAIRFNSVSKPPEAIGLYKEAARPRNVDFDRSRPYLTWLLRQLDALDLGNDAKALQWWDLHVTGKAPPTTTTTATHGAAPGPGQPSSFTRPIPMGQRLGKPEDDNQTKDKAPEKDKEDPANKNESEKKGGEKPKGEEKKPALVALGKPAGERTSPPQPSPQLQQTPPTTQSARGKVSTPAHVLLLF